MCDWRDDSFGTEEAGKKTQIATHFQLVVHGKITRQDRECESVRSVERRGNAQRRVEGENGGESQKEKGIGRRRIGEA